MPSHLTKVWNLRVLFLSCRCVFPTQALAAASIKPRNRLPQRLITPFRTIPTNVRFLPGIVCALYACLPAAGRGADPAAASVRAQNTSSADGAQAPPAINFHVLRPWRVGAGSHAVILSRVAPPALPAPTPPTAAEFAAADGGYAGALVDWARQLWRCTLEIVKRSDLHDFRVLPRRWVVERTFGWLGRYRRLNRDCQRQAQTGEVMVCLAMSR